MRILHLQPFYFPYAGGIERRIREIGRRHAKDHDVHLLTARLPNTKEEERDEGIEIHRVPSRFRLGRFYNPPLVASRGLHEAIKRIDPDVIDCHFRWSRSYGRAFAGADAARVFTYHNTYGEGSGALGLLSRLNDRSTRRYVAASDRIVCISEFLREDLRANGFPQDRLRVVPNGVDAAALRHVAALPRPDPDLILAVGRLVALKGYDTLLRALAVLPAAFRLRVCGEGPQRRALVALSTRLGVADRAEFPGWVPEDQKLGALASCFAFAHPSRFEAFGLAPLEAMAMGAPVVASSVGGLPEVVAEAGILVPPDDPKALAEALRRMHDDPAIRAKAKAAAERQVRRFSWDTAARDLLRVYQEAVRNHETLSHANPRGDLT